MTVKLETFSGVRGTAERPSVDKTLANRPEKKQTNKQTGSWGVITALALQV